MKKYYTVLAVLAGLLVVSVIVYLVVKPSKIQPTDKTAVVNNAASNLGAQYSKADLQILYDSWAANGYPGTFENYVKG